MAKKFSDDEDLIAKFAREPIDDWNKNSYLANISCQN